VSTTTRMAGNLSFQASLVNDDTLGRIRPDMLGHDSPR